MGKVQVLAVLSMDGCLASELHGKSYKGLCLDSCGINEIRENALYPHHTGLFHLHAGGVEEI